MTTTTRSSQLEPTPMAVAFQARGGRLDQDAGAVDVFEGHGVRPQDEIESASHGDLTSGSRALGGSGAREGSESNDGRAG